MRTTTMATRRTIPVSAVQGLRRRLARADVFLLASAALLMALGAAFIDSATHGEGGFLGKQLVFIALGSAACLALQFVDLRTMLKWAPTAYFTLLVLLVAVLFTRPINGARSWFNLYVFNLQPSELMKPVLIVTLAYYLMYRDSYKRLLGLAVPLVLCFVPVMLILRQPDMGTAMVLVPVVFAMLYAAGARWWHLGLMILSGCGGLVGMWFTVMTPVQKLRILAWLNPDAYVRGAAWQPRLSEMAIGSGGWSGMGWGWSGDGNLTLLPEKHTDFIFSVMAVEGGFVLAAFVVALVVVLCLSALGIADRTREPAGRMIAVGVATLLGAQALINIGVTLRLLPTTGVTLPFVSYGGSSLLSSLLCLGLLVNVGTRREPVFARDDFA
ncbi:MAG: FtsW/RodA/SpoVE family cell cycle protein [Planctomycetes bacterium]|nr:FtsW/RodA/SpoVE family cell cycle protein [Planctomycetota bacterium]